MQITAQLRKKTSELGKIWVLLRIFFQPTAYRQIVHPNEIIIYYGSLQDDVGKHLKLNHLAAPFPCMIIAFCYINIETTLHGLQYLD